MGRSNTRGGSHLAAVRDTVWGFLVLRARMPQTSSEGDFPWFEASPKRSASDTGAPRLRGRQLICSRGGSNLLERWIKFAREVDHICSRGGSNLLERWITFAREVDHICSGGSHLLDRWITFVREVDHICSGGSHLLERWITFPREVDQICSCGSNLLERWITFAQEVDQFSHMWIIL